jgi:hypothetical protein
MFTLLMIFLVRTDRALSISAWKIIMFTSRRTSPIRKIMVLFSGNRMFPKSIQQDSAYGHPTLFSEMENTTFIFLLFQSKDLNSGEVEFGLQFLKSLMGLLSLSHVLSKALIALIQTLFLIRITRPIFIGLGTENCSWQS